ncbi:amylo-alpha-1,6-glucosidase [Bacillus sp. FJAT-42376]|uniref:amylo-alpha-1,6-glucosidase n=1 Tax=Bacillus sp. FJAT-42376 TaxID=2014076 RepID=UPI000F503634|nr:amylo-alpha-1,6-glucosidase [Bacillus sp. FJAT-42376]AZB42451.1 amylo-alpha-1,6-glucosidase [Bacillus sp. FJAT-42376]
MDYLVIKENDLFLLSEPNGDITGDHSYGLGLYSKDTRFLSKLELTINGEKPVLLSSDGSDNRISKVLLTNPHMEDNGELILWRESVQVERERFIAEEVLYETITLKNYFPKAVSFSIELAFEADFKDMFIVRGFQSGHVGERAGQAINENAFSIHYEGADQISRSTVVSWDKKPDDIQEHGLIAYHFDLEHGQEDSFTVKIQPLAGNGTKDILSREEALEKLTLSYEEWQQSSTTVKTDLVPLQNLLDRGMADLRVLMTDIGHGIFPVAGLPWFGVPFGRDSLIAALQMLAFNPEVAKGTLKTMASTQGTKVDPWRDEQPGKIMHEMRFGELANTNQIPFTPYYGTIDATPLYLILLTEYVKWTGDLKLAEELMDSVEQALLWIDEYGDRDGDLFVEYHQESSKGIANQGWKDSGDSIVHRNGDYAKTPIALAEVQGYVYQAKMGIADILDALDQKEKSARLKEQAEALKQKFEKEFWMEDKQFYAIALDQNKKQVGTITSNPGHVLFSGIIDSSRADKVADMLTSDKMFSGFGIRTMGEGEAGYNPMSYHDGSVWPHDNSMTLIGMSKLKQQKQAKKVMSGLIKAADHFEYERLPELFCGYSSAVGKAVKYPVACSPQAWAAGTPLIFIQSILGLFPDSLNKRISLSPDLLEEMNELQVSGISIGNGILSVRLYRSEKGTEFEITENTTGFEIITAGAGSPVQNN